MKLRRITPAALAGAAMLGFTVAIASAQTTPAPAQKPPCPPVEEQTKAAGKKAASGMETPPAQPMEKSGVLPSAGSDGSSAAPTVQQKGEPVISAADCALSPDHPNALTRPQPAPVFSAPPPK